MEKSTEADALINEIERVQYVKDKKRAVTRVAAGIKSPVVFSGSVYQKRLMITNVSTRQSLIILFFFYCEREEREN
jgi:hypothetical protein